MEGTDHPPGQGSFLASGEGICRRWGFWILTVFAVFYYGAYYRAGLYPAAEGGDEGMVALRLMAGQRPIVDTFMGYNLLWFYPVVAIFKLFGPSYTALRIFFLILCWATGLMAFRLVFKCTGRAGVAFLAGLLALVIPGQMYRNYMAFIVVLNMTTFLSAYVLPSRAVWVRLCWMAASGVTLAIAWLVRVDVGFFLTCVLTGLILVFPIGSGLCVEVLRRTGLALLAVLLVLAGLFLTHCPFYLDASHRGFGKEFVAQYQQWPAMIQFQGRQILETLTKSAANLLKKAPEHSQISESSPKILPTPPTTPLQAAPAQATQGKGTVQPPALNPGVPAPLSPAEVKEPRETKEFNMTLQRRSVVEGVARDRMMALNLYLPVLVIGMLAFGALAAWLLALWRHEELPREQALMLLTCLGCSLALFPQYFFWRPDMVHLSEFMVPMTLTLLVACVAAFRAWPTAGRLPRAGLGIFLFFAFLTLLLYYINACQSQASGGIAVSQKKTITFRAANGVNVKLSPGEYQDAFAIYRIVTAVSLSGEYLICYPYNPEINFMTDRPSYEYNFYVDNVMIPPEHFYQETMEKISTRHPVGFVITDWEINNTEQSKFTNWAARTYDYIATHYIRAYQHGNVEVFVRPDRAAAIPPLGQDGWKKQP